MLTHHLPGDESKSNLQLRVERIKKVLGDPSEVSRDDGFGNI
jgi:hypothetical protein